MGVPGGKPRQGGGGGPTPPPLPLPPVPLPSCTGTDSTCQTGRRKATEYCWRGKLQAIKENNNEQKSLKVFQNIQKSSLWHGCWSSRRWFVSVSRCRCRRTSESVECRPPPADKQPRPKIDPKSEGAAR